MNKIEFVLICTTENNLKVEIISCIFSYYATGKFLFLTILL